MIVFYGRMKYHNEKCTLFYIHTEYLIKIKKLFTANQYKKTNFCFVLNYFIAD